MRRSAYLAATLPLALALFGAPEAKAVPSACDAVAGNLVQNCGFETTGGWSQNLTDWFGPHTGVAGGSVDSNGTAAYSQTISGLTPGETYNFSAWILDGFGSSAIMVATIGVDPLFSITASGSWSEQTGSFTATSASMLLTIGTPVGNGGYGGIDDVSIVATSTPVPEPASAALLGLGLAGLASLRRRR